AAFAPGLIGTATGAAVIAGVGTVASVGTSLAISAGLAAALTPGLPSPEFAATPIKQSRPVRVSGTGRARLSGAYVLFEARGNLSDDVLALHHGKIDGIERYFLH